MLQSVLGWISRALGLANSNQWLIIPRCQPNFFHITLRFQQNVSILSCLNLFFFFFLFSWFCSFFPSSVLLCFTQRFYCILKGWKFSPHHIRFNGKRKIFDIKQGQGGSEETASKEERRAKEKEFTAWNKQQLEEWKVKAAPGWRKKLYLRSESWILHQEVPKTQRNQSLKGRMEAQEMPWMASAPPSSCWSKGNPLFLGAASPTPCQHCLHQPALLYIQENGHIPHKREAKIQEFTREDHPELQEGCAHPPDTDFSVGWILQIKPDPIPAADCSRPQHSQKYPEQQQLQRHTAES